VIQAIEKTVMVKTVQTKEINFVFVSLFIWKTAKH